MAGSLPHRARAAAADRGPQDFAEQREALIDSVHTERIETVEHVLAPGRQAWVHVARGSVTLDGEPLGAGDAAHVVERGSIRLNSPSSTEVLLFDLP